ncbi:unnamed protein product [Rotaria sordida]|uniref:Uncharacterized protein n=1 Tax=Rotaria sordida TaxID=392033 RepID=A0A814MGC0_9BILA|nr:unnamed protein product [Rotaria sordida]CAF1022759.1 unnamed protein product [Rotaria sordida]CAF1079335.1 unnamed protein product [Rotaria sordida]CAF1115935.1 unnamed protein product [Rotaria sordida]CAF1118770.1 unnamed protein product [Rotaria sordida]
MSRTITTCTFQFILFLYEYLAWQLEIKNYTTHSHHRDLFGSNTYFLIVQINSLPHLAAVYVYYHRIKWAMLLYIPYLILFTIGQIFTWWLPYFFQKGLWYSDETGEKLAQYKKYHTNYHRILPRFKDHVIIPDTEHTILFILTLITLILTIRTMILTIKNKTLKIKSQ